MGTGFVISAVGLVLSDIPGKRRLLYGLMRVPKVGAATNWVRRKMGREPFYLNENELIPPADTSAPASAQPHTEAMEKHPQL